MINLWNRKIWAIPAIFKRRLVSEWRSLRNSAMVSFHSSGILQKRLFQFWGNPIILEKWIDVATRSCNVYPCKDTQIPPSCWHHPSDPPKVVERTAPGLLAHHPDTPEPSDRVVQADPTAFGTTHAGEIQNLWDMPLVAGFERKWIWSRCVHTQHHAYPESSWVTVWTSIPFSDQQSVFCQHHQRMCLSCSQEIKVWIWKHHMIHNICKFHMNMLFEMLHWYWW